MFLLASIKSRLEETGVLNELQLNTIAANSRRDEFRRTADVARTKVRVDLKRPSMLSAASINNMLDLAHEGLLDESVVIRSRSSESSNKYSKLFK